jgi:benzoate-CoA ligase
MPYGAVRAISFPDRFNLSTVLLDVHLDAGRGEKVALRSSEEDVTYADLAARVARFAGVLDGLGVRPGERVAILLDDHPGFHTAFLGAVRAGCQAIPMNTALTAEDYRHVLHDSGARVLVVEQAYSSMMGTMVTDLPDLKHVLVAGDGAGSLPWGHHDLDTLLAQQRDERPPADTAPTDPAYWLYTSGSTGRPKGAVHLQTDPVYIADFFARDYAGLTSDDVIFSPPRLYFAYGLGNSLYIPLRLGGTALLSRERPDPAGTFELIDRFRPTALFFVPTGYAQLLVRDRADGIDHDLSSIRLAVVGGEPLTDSLRDRWRQRFGHDLLEGWGSTEASHIMIGNPRGAIKVGSCGQAVDGFQARLSDPDGKECGPDEPGVLEVRGGSVAAYYWQRPDKTSEAFREDGWFRTGDRCTVDADGYFWFLGRTDDMIKAGAMWVSPAEVENAVCESPEVLEAAVAAVADADGAIRPVAFVVLNNGVTPSPELAETIRQHVRSRLAHYKAPRVVEFVAELPKTATGKIQRFKLRETGAVTEAPNTEAQNTEAQNTEPLNAGPLGVGPEPLEAGPVSHA